MASADFEELRAKVAKISDKRALVACNAELCAGASLRLSALVEAVEARSDEDKQAAVAVLILPAREFLDMLRAQSHNRFSLYWLAWSQRLVTTVWKVHEKVSDAIDKLGLNLDTPATDWSELVLAGRRVQQERLAEMFIDINRVIKEAPPTKIKETLEFMKNQLTLRFDTTVAQEERHGALDAAALTQMQPEMAELMMSTFNRILTAIDLAGAYDWFLPKECIDRGAKIGNGTFGSVYKATQTLERTGEKRVVALKTLDINIANVDEDATFSREIEAWVNLAIHKHILRLFGANHTSRPKFFVMEYASEGNLEAFFNDESNRKFVWHFLGQAAEGLKALHSGERPVEHGALKTNNMLLARDDSGELVVKISDFGMSVIRVESVSVSKHAQSDKSLWRAPERFKNSTETTDFRKADIYCLGLCVIDAATGEPPFAGLDAEEIVGSKIDDLRVPTPENGFSADEWEFVDKMCDPNPALRPNLDEIIAGMVELDKIRQAKWPTGFLDPASIA